MLQSAIGSNAHLERCGRAIGLEEYINKNSSHHGAVPKRTMSAAVEALIGAVFIDSGESLHAVNLAIRGLGLLNEFEAEDFKKGKSKVSGNGRGGVDLGPGLVIRGGRPDRNLL